MTTVGLIGSGRIGGTVARLAVAAGHQLQRHLLRAFLAGGRIVEAGETAAVLADPQEEYTQELIANTPSLEVATAEAAAVEAAATGQGLAAQS